jgi:hypothetical protein
MEKMMLDEGGPQHSLAGLQKDDIFDHIAQSHDDGKYHIHHQEGSDNR